MGGVQMSMEDLTDDDLRVFEYMRTYDFETYPWSTPDAAEYLEMSEDEVYESMANIAKHIKEHVWIHYKDGGIRVTAE